MMILGIIIETAGKNQNREVNKKNQLVTYKEYIYKVLIKKNDMNIA